MKATDVVAAAFDPEDNPFEPPEQSEQQKKGTLKHMHGLRIWDMILRYINFVRPTRASILINITLVD